MSEELIRRSDAIKHLKKWFHSKGWMVSDEDCKSILWDIPSADRPQGEWIDRSDGGRILHPWWESCECNQCKEWGSGAWNFCPHCGARMKGADDE